VSRLLWHDLGRSTTRLMQATAMLACLCACSGRAVTGPERRQDDQADASGRSTSLPSDDPRVARWETEIAALEALDANEPAPPDAILFVGSSSIRLWDSIADDMAPRPVIRRGYGGARYRDLAHFASRLVSPHRCRAIVVFVANDITPGEPATVADVMQDVRAVHARIRARHPETPLFFVAVTPTESRWPVWPTIARLNAAIAEMSAAEPATFFIATADRFLDPESGRPNAALFRADRLHLNHDGYRAWAAALAAALDEVLADLPAAVAR
jgi:lysophospholipase L1-like esterase